MDELQKEIQRKCRKNSESLVFRDKTENDEYQKEYIQQENDVSIMKNDEIAEELAFEEILAEKRRKYTAKEEFIYLLYNDILPTFVTKWNGYFLKKQDTTAKISSCGDDIEENEEIYDSGESIDLTIDEKEKENILPWKLSLPDEIADIKFYNNNSYHGRISRKMMEGEGIYEWHNGVHYKGQFEQNQIRGRGILKWSDDCWYEGDFMNGLRHGMGTAYDGKYDRISVGQWLMGHKKK